jgi:nucleotide-binding universal stress UspA family protein
MVRSILVPLDGTWYGEHALPTAIAVARRTGATLHLVHVNTEVAFPVAIESLPYLGANVPLVPVEVDHEYVHRLAERLTAMGLDAHGVVRRGSLADSLGRYAIECGADLIVACTHCHEGISRLWHRGVGEQILDEAGIPILFIRADDTRPDLAERREFRHLLVPLDGSSFGEKALDCAIPLATAFGAKLTLLRVVRPIATTGFPLLGEEGPPDPVILEDQRLQATQYLESVASRIGGGLQDVRTRVVTGEEPALAIVDATRPDLDLDSPPVDLVAMATHCRGRLMRALLSSVSDEVLHNVPIPLLLHHPVPEQAAGTSHGTAKSAKGTT